MKQINKLISTRLKSILIYFSEEKETRKRERFDPFDVNPDDPFDVYNGRLRILSPKGKSYDKEAFLIFRIGVVTEM